MATRHKKAWLALFFLVALSALGLFLAAVIGTRLLGKRDLYTIEFTDTPVSGLNKGAAVKYLGYSVGRIEDIYISSEDVNTVVVEISVEQRQRRKRDSRRHRSPHGIARNNRPQAHRAIRREQRSRSALRFFPSKPETRSSATCKSAQKF